MAGDWIKMRVGLTTNPRVMRLAECLLEDAEYLEWSGLAYGMAGYPPTSEAELRNERHGALRVTRYVTVTALLRFWGYANEHIKGEFIAGIFPEDVDEISGVPGFASAIEAAGWAEFDQAGGLNLPNFSEHNTSAGERSGGAERQKRYRERLKTAPESDVTRDVTVTDREEKRREEKKEQKPPVVPKGDDASSAVLTAYHTTLPNCQRCETLTPKRRKRIQHADKLARQLCEQQGWDYDAPDFWGAYFGECQQDPWLRGDVPNPNNPRWKQNLDVLLAEDRFAGIMDAAIAAMRAES